MARPLWFVELLKKSFPQNHLLAKLTKAPGIGRIMEFLLFEGDDIIYLPKDAMIQVNKAITRPDELVLPSQVVDHFIEEANYLWRMNFCICRASLKCDDYPTDLGCIFLGEAVLGINPHLGQQVTKEEARAHIQRCQEAGLIHLVGRNKLDTVWLKIGPGDKLLTICNCCPCCCLWRVAPHLASHISNKVTPMPGISIRVDKDKCIGCGTCSSGVCFVNAIQVENKRAVINKECRICGRCVAVCPQKAIQITVYDDNFVKDSIERISALVDVA
ncbi:MAG: DUF362 domain-containing protein [Candidatus Heimdallarchaeota archaeon]